MKRIIAICMMAAALSAFAGCGKTAEKATSKAESAVSKFDSKMDSVAEEIGEGVTDAVSDILSRADDMIDNGQISDGDGIIGNEERETEPETMPETMPEDNTDITEVTE